MDFAQMVARINELARKQKAVGLTPVEAEEQSMLRRRYIDAFKRSLRTELESIHFADEKDSGRGKMSH